VRKSKASYNQVAMYLFVAETCNGAKSPLGRAGYTGGPDDVAQSQGPTPAHGQQPLFALEGLPHLFNGVDGHRLGPRVVLHDGCQVHL
jgi:hypothetical protein